MKKNHFAVLLLLMILLFVVGTVVVAQSSANFDLSWNVIGNGVVKPTLLVMRFLVLWGREWWGQRPLTAQTSP